MPPTARRTRRLTALALAAASIAPAGVAAAAPGPAPGGHLTGALADGATWVIDVPAHWNGTLLLYSHGLVPPGADNPAQDAPDPVTSQALLGAGFALAGSSYATTGFAVEDALRDQRAMLDVVRERIGRPARTIAWGSSLGGMVSAGLLERYPQLFDGGYSMCGVLAGSVALWNSYLDPLFVLRTFLAPDVELVRVTDPFAAIGALQAALDGAQQTPQGRARIA